MKWLFTAVAIAGITLPLSAQQQNFRKEDYRQAISFYVGALRDKPYAGLFLQAEIEKETCGLIVEREQLEWLKEYSANKPSLGKLGIRPSSVEILKANATQRLALNLISRLQTGKPIQEACMFCICAGGMCGTAEMDLMENYKVIDYLEGLAKEDPVIRESISLANFQKVWDESVIRSANLLTTRCQDRIQYDPQSSWTREYSECNTLIEALEHGVEPSTLKMNPDLTQKLRSVARKK